MNKINVALLRKIQKRILAEPAQFEMADWFRIGEGIPNCKTSACIAGWAVTLGTKKTRPLVIAEYLRKKMERPHCKIFDGDFAALVKPKAMKLLGIDEWQASRLFYSNNWPSPFREYYTCSCSHQVKARIAVDRIEHFIQTNGEE